MTLQVSFYMLSLQYNWPPQTIVLYLCQELGTSLERKHTMSDGLAINVHAKMQAAPHLALLDHGRNTLVSQIFFFLCDKMTEHRTHQWSQQHHSQSTALQTMQVLLCHQNAGHAQQPRQYCPER